MHEKIQARMLALKGLCLINRVIPQSSTGFTSTCEEFDWLSGIILHASVAHCVKAQVGH